MHGWKKVPLKDVMKLKNFFALFLLMILEILISAALVGVVYRITNQVIGVYVAYAIFVITIICIQLNAEAYVKSLADKGKVAAIDADAFAAAFAELAPGTRRALETAPALPKGEGAPLESTETESAQGEISIDKLSDDSEQKD